MGSLRDIKKRMNNIGVVAKVTQSMKVISTSRLYNAKLLRKENSAYFSTSKFIIDTLFSLQKETNQQLEILNLLLSNKKEAPYNKTLLIPVASDRGLCGSYNLNVTKATDAILRNLGSDKFAIMPLGLQAYNYVNRSAKLSYFGLTIISDPRKEIEAEIHIAVAKIIDAITKRAIDNIEIISTRSVNILEQEVYVDKIFPILQDDDNKVNQADQADVPKNIVTDNKNFPEIIEELLRQYLFIKIYDKLTESAVAEHASRLNAMSIAYDNSKEMKRLLNLEYNRTRQSMITNELIEIISGAEAL